jgi:hypothetical protein
VLTCGYLPRRDGGTGRRSGLKIRRPSGLGGSTPPPGTKLTVSNFNSVAVSVQPRKEIAGEAGKLLEKRGFDVYVAIDVQTTL